MCRHPTPDNLFPTPKKPNSIRLATSSSSRGLYNICCMSRKSHIQSNRSISEHHILRLGWKIYCKSRSQVPEIAESSERGVILYAINDDYILSRDTRRDTGNKRPCPTYDEICCKYCGLGRRKCRKDKRILTRQYGSRSIVGIIQVFARRYKFHRRQSGEKEL